MCGSIAFKAPELPPIPWQPLYFPSSVYLPTSQGGWLYWNRPSQVKGSSRPHLLQGEGRWGHSLGWPSYMSQCHRGGSFGNLGGTRACSFSYQCFRPCTPSAGAPKTPSQDSQLRKARSGTVWDQATKQLPIPSMINLYNHNMNGVDRWDQLKALRKAPRANKNWKILFYDSIQLFFCNVSLFSKHPPQGCLKEFLDSIEFKRAVIEALISRKSNWGVCSAHPRLDWHFIEDESLPRWYLGAMRSINGWRYPSEPAGSAGGIGRRWKGG